ncbi:19452_t:CDS:2, partial [Gigaspora rosea]
MENETKNEIISHELEENSHSSANFEFNNLTPSFLFPGSALGSDFAGILP